MYIFVYLFYNFLWKNISIYSASKIIKRISFKYEAKKKINKLNWGNNKLHMRLFDTEKMGSKENIFQNKSDSSTVHFIF